MSRRQWYGKSTPCQLLRWFCTHIGRRVRLPAVAAIVAGAANGRACVAPLVPLGRHEIGVHRLVRQVQEERPSLGALAEPLEGVVGQLVGDVALLRHALAVDVQAVWASGR